MNYDDEYDGYDDVYGHSVEDDYSASPSMAHFMYDRSQGTKMSAFLQSDIQEEDETLDNTSGTDTLPKHNRGLNLSNFGSTNLCKPTLSQLASLRSTPTLQLQTNSGFHSIKKGCVQMESSKKPSLADLAKMNFKSKQDIKVGEPSKMFSTSIQKTEKIADTKYQQPDCNLSIAKRRVPCTIEPSIKTHHYPVPRLLSKENGHMIHSFLHHENPSPFGRVLVKKNLATTTVFIKSNSMKKRCFFDSTVIQPFSFSTPSPDDLIKTRLQMQM